MSELYKMALPPAFKLKDDGTERKVGIEIELAGLPAEGIAEQLKEQLGGDLECHTIFNYTLKDSSLGDFTIELDAEYFKDFAEILGLQADASSESDVLEFLEQKSKEALTKTAETFVPWEIVSPPIRFSELKDFNKVIPMLREAGALGTRDSVRFAFGVHFNPEIPNLEAKTILSYLKAYFCLYDWITQDERIDLSRKLTPYIHHFSKDYIALVLSEQYQPSIETLIDDYLEYNPTRNRSLDMLPMFAHIDEKRVRKVVADSRVKTRPTFHYRLPNCDIDNPDWSLDQSWQNWLLVEKLSASPNLQKICNEYLESLPHLLPGTKSAWAEHLEEILPEAA